MVYFLSRVDDLDCFKHVVTLDLSFRTNLFHYTRKLLEVKPYKLNLIYITFLKFVQYRSEFIMKFIYALVHGVQCSFVSVLSCF